jgi:prohibitin 2
MKTFVGVVVGVIAVALLVVIFGSYTVIGSGERGVVTRFGKVSDKVLEPGAHGKSWFDDVHKMDVKTRTISFDNQQQKGDNSEKSSLFAATKDLQDVQIAVVVNWHLAPNNVQEIYRQYSSVENYEAQVLSPSIRESVKAISAQYTAEELVTKRGEFSDKVNSDLTKKFQEKNADIESFKITNLQFSDAFNQAIEAKVTAQQNAEAAKNKLEQVKYEAQQQIETAKATAEAQRISSAALAAQGGADYVQLQAINKWDGHLPSQMIPGATVPFVNVTK